MQSRYLKYLWILHATISPATVLRDTERPRMVCTWMNKFNTCRDIYAHVGARSCLNLADCLAKIAEGKVKERGGL